MLCPSRGVDGDPGLAFQEMHGAEIDSADAVDFTGHKCVRPSCLVCERHQLYPIEIGPPFLPVIRIAFAHIAHARLELG